jgi:hypothetical protein
MRGLVNKTVCPTPIVAHQAINEPDSIDNDVLR